MSYDEWPFVRAIRGERLQDCEATATRLNTGSSKALSINTAVISGRKNKPDAFILTFRDISARRQAEEHLRQIHQRLEYHIQNTPLAVVEFDSELRVRAWSTGAERVFGWSESEVVGKQVWEIPWICEEDRSRIESLATALTSGHTLRSVSPNRNIRKDGAIIWCEWYNSSLTDAHGNLQSIQSLVLDVTERRKAEEALRQSEEFTRRVTEVAPSILYIYDLDERRNVWGSRDMTAVLGYTREQIDSMAGHLLETLLHPDDRLAYAHYASRLSELADGETAQLEYRMQRADRSWSWLHSRDTVFRRHPSGRPFQILGAALDVTHCKQAEEALLQSEERFKLATDATGYGTFDFYPQTGELIWSTHTKRHFGLGPSASIDYSTFLQGIHPADRTRIDHAVKEALCPESGGVYRVEYRTIGVEDRKERWIQATGQVFFDATCQPIRFIGGTVDITQQKAFQVELERLVSE
jgi:PAS domain S-box-containing protein